MCCQSIHVHSYYNILWNASNTYNTKDHNVVVTIKLVTVMSLVLSQSVDISVTHSYLWTWQLCIHQHGNVNNVEDEVYNYTTIQCNMDLYAVRTTTLHTISHSTCC